MFKKLASMMLAAAMCLALGVSAVRGRYRRKDVAAGLRSGQRCDRRRGGGSDRENSDAGP